MNHMHMAYGFQPRFRNFKQSNTTYPLHIVKVRNACERSGFVVSGDADFERPIVINLIELCQDFDIISRW